MTEQEYLVQNELGFEGDAFLQPIFESLVKKHKVSAIIETGTYLGSTTLKFAEIADIVFTIEYNAEYYNKAKKKIDKSGKNIVQYFGSSARALPMVIDNTSQHENRLFFLDAHWGDNNPLLEELAAIAKAGLKPVIAIHDFKVPDRLDLGFDSYGGQDYTWEWIAASIEQIYGKDGYSYFYNNEATGAKRGVIFIEPK